MGVTRRALLEHIARSGGLGAAYMAMETMGLATPSPTGAEKFSVPSPRSKRSVVILGAGIAGLVCAYELKRAGYRVHVLEARNRIGGRSWTIRDGDVVEQIGRPKQRASFERGLYFNAGAARIAGTHRLMLNYARVLGVPLETFVNTNRNACWDFGGRVQPERRMVEDMRGHVAELLAKAIDIRSLDAFVPQDELEAFRQFLPYYGSLDTVGSYVPAGRSGYLVAGGGYNQAPVPLPPLTLPELMPAIGAKQQRGSFVVPYIFEHIWDMQPAMLQPVGGMDRIAQALYEPIKADVQLGTVVTAIRRNSDGVSIHYGPGQSAVMADYCVCTLPLTILRKIPADFSTAKREAIEGAPAYQHSVKVAFESARFWEVDDSIYGGLAWTDRPNENIIYPSGGFNTKKGILVPAYCAGWTRADNPEAFEACSHEERFAICRESVERLHPGKARLLQNGVTVAWKLTPYSEGMSATWPIAPKARDRGAVYQELLRPEGPVVFAGEHLSYQPAWQEGAASSAHEALKLVAQMANEQAP